MLRKGMVKAVIIIASTIFMSLAFTGCPSKITEEQMAQLQELKKEERSLKQEISNSESEIKKLESELQSRKAQLDECNKKKDFVEQKLRKWPNVWPD